MNADIISREQLKSLIDRIEELEKDKAGVADDIKCVYAEAKSVGYDTKILRKVVAIRKRKARDLAEENELIELYLEAIDDQLSLFEKADVTISADGMEPISLTGEQLDAATSSLRRAARGRKREAEPAPC